MLEIGEGMGVGGGGREPAILEKRAQNKTSCSSKNFGSVFSITYFQKCGRAAKGGTWIL